MEIFCPMLSAGSFVVEVGTSAECIYVQPSKNVLVSVAITFKAQIVTILSVKLQNKLDNRLLHP